MDLSELHIRRINADEGELWREIRMRMVKDCPDVFFDEIGELASRSPDWFSTHAQRCASGGVRCIYFAETDDEVIGSACGAIDGTASRGADGSIAPELLGMWVVPELRSIGIGERLVKSVEKWAANEVNSASLQLTVNETNDKAQNFYKRIGFRLDGRSAPSRVKPGTLTLFMVKRFDDQERDD